MITTNGLLSPSSGSSLRLTIHDVTGTHRAELSGVDPALPVTAVAETVAARMSLPVDGTSWALRTESTARYLDDVSIGEALADETGTGGSSDPVVSLVLTPKTHLGGARG